MANHERIHLNLKASPVKNYTGGIAADDIPDEMIHRIQSFMDARLAARSTVLFKSWRLAWLARPDLDFRDQDFQSRLIEFREFALNTLQRYRDSKLRIYTFRLEMVIIVDHYLAIELIMKAIRLGATNLTLRFRKNAHDMFNLPNVVLDSETLAELSAHECLIDLRFGEKEVSLSNLKTLSLSRVVAYGDLFLDLISKCPSLEKITLNSTVSLPSWFPKQTRISPSLDSMIQLHKLKSLQLIGLDSRDYMYRHDLWPKFPWLKELEIWDVDSNYNWTSFRICSPSLELITLYMYSNQITNGAFDVPNIRKFKVVGVHLPQLDEFNTSSNSEWESDIQVECYPFTASWFSSLSKLLRMLSSSRISLSVCMTYSHVANCYAYVGDGLPILAVEKLTISGFYPLVFSAFLSAMFFSCRPNLVFVNVRFMGGVNLEAAFRQLHYRPLLH